MDVLVMGGSRFMGRAAVRILADAGHRLIVFNRGTRTQPRDDVKVVLGDRNEVTSVEQLRALSVDAIVDLSGYTGRQVELLLDVMPQVLRHVHISTGAVYRPQPVLPWPEETPYGPWSLWGSYAAEKLAGERVLRERRPADAATTVLRFPYVLGPGNYADREEFVLNRILDGAELLLPGDGEALQQFVSVDQVAAAILAAVQSRDTGGLRAYNIASPGYVSLAGFAALCGEAVSREPVMRPVGGGATGGAGATFDPTDCVYPFPNVNYLLDFTASVRDGIAPPSVTVQTMIASALEHLRAHPERRAWERTPAEQRHLA